MPTAHPSPVDESSSPLRGKAFLSTYATAVQGLARLLFSVLVGRLGGSRELLGQANSALSLSVLSSQLWAAPAAIAGTRFVSERLAMGDPEGATGIARHLARRTAVIGSVLPTAVAVGGSLWLGFDTVHAVLTVVLAWAYSLYSTTRGASFGAQRYRFVAKWDTIAGLTALAVTAIVLITETTALVLLPLALGYALFAAAAWPRGPGSGPSRSARRRIDQFILFGVISGVTSGGLLQGSQIAAHHFGGADGAGLYAASLSLATPTSMLAIALGTVIVPPLVRAAATGDRAEVQRQSDRVVRQMSVILVAIFGALVVVSPLLLKVAYGAAFADSSVLLPILLVAVMLSSIALAAATFLQSTKSRGPALVAGVNAIGLLVSLAAWVLLGDQHGVVGVALGYLCGAGLASVILFGSVWWLEQHRWVGLAVKLLGAVGVMTLLHSLTSTIPGGRGVVTQLLASLLFLALWAAVNRRDVRLLARILRGG